MDHKLLIEHEYQLSCGLVMHAEGTDFFSLDMLCNLYDYSTNQVLGLLQDNNNFDWGYVDPISRVSPLIIFK